MNSQIQVFNFNTIPVRTMIGTDNEPWFVAKDVCDILEYSNPSKAIHDHVDDEDKLNNESLSSLGQRGGWLINESGLYSLVLRSQTPNARTFKRWVTHEVLPQIRKTGGYIPTSEADDEMTILAKGMLIAQKTIEAKNNLINAQARQLKEQEHKVLFADAVSASDGTCLVGELAKMISQAGYQIGQNRLFQWFRDHQYLGSRGSNFNVPTQRSMELGLFKIKETAVTHADGHVSLNRTAKVTGKGQTYFLRKFTEFNGVIR